MVREKERGKRGILFSVIYLTLLLLNTACPEEATWSGSALFVIKCVNFYQKPGSSNLIGWKLEVGMAS